MVAEKVYYAEVYSILNYLGEEYKNKIPEKLLNVIENSRDKYSTFKLEENKKLKEQVLCQETKDFLAALNLLYWEKNEERKSKLLSIYKKNDIIYEKEQKEKYSYENLFKNNKVTENEDLTAQNSETQNNTQLVEVKETFIHNIISKIKQWFWRFKK